MNIFIYHSKLTLFIVVINYNIYANLRQLADSFIWWSFVRSDGHTTELVFEKKNTMQSMTKFLFALCLALFVHIAKSSVDEGISAARILLYKVVIVLNILLYSILRS